MSNHAREELVVDEESSEEQEDESEGSALTEIVRQIDGFARQHGKQKSRAEGSEGTKAKTVATESSESAGAGHFRGVSFGVDQPTNARDVVGKGERNGDYLKLLEDDNELLKRNNEVLLRTLGEKDRQLSAQRLQNEALMKQNVPVL